MHCLYVLYRPVCILQYLCAVYKNWFIEDNTVKRDCTFRCWKCSLPTFASKWCAKGGGVFLGAYSILSDIYLRELSDVIDVCLLSGAVESSAVIVPQQALRQSLLLFCCTTCSSSAALLQVVDKLVVDAPLNQQVLTSLMFWTSWWSFHYWWRVYLSCNFDCMLSVGPISFEDRFCASKKGGIEGGGQT